MAHRLSAPEVRLDNPRPVQRHASDVGCASTVPLATFKNKVSMHMPQFGQLRRASLTSSMIKVNPNVRRVPSDRTHVGAFQKLLSTFDDVPPDCGETGRSIVTTLNGMLQSVISAVVHDFDNAKIAREGSVHAITLFVHGVQAVATEVANPVLATLLHDLSDRILELDKFVRGYFILETLELDQVIASLDDSLDQAHSRIKALQDECHAMAHTHKRKIAEAKLMAVIHDAKVANMGDPSLRTRSPAPDTSSSTAAFTLASANEDVYDVNARLTKHVSELTAALALARSELDSALREVDVLKADVDALGASTFKDIYVQQLTNELHCERKRVKALELEVHDLRVKQAELAKGVLQKHSLVHRFRSTVQRPPTPSTEDEDSAAMTDSSADENSSVANVEREKPTTATVSPSIQRARHTFKVMLNVDVKLSDILSPSKRSMSAVANVAHAVVKLKAKLQNKTHLGTTVPAELIALRQRVNALYDRKRHYDEFTALLPRGDHGIPVSFLELSLGWFVAKYSKLQDAEAEAKAFMADLNRFRSICGHIWLMEEFLHGKHSDEAVSFYLWVVQGIHDVKIGVQCPITPESNPHFICKFKATLVTRTIFRALRFHTCGFGTPVASRGADLARDDTLDVMSDCHRLFSAAAAGGPMYLGEFHAVLDKFVTTNATGDDVYPLDVYLYLLVLLFKKQKEWQVTHVVELFHKEAMDAMKDEMRWKEATRTATTTSKTRSKQGKPTKKSKSAKRRRNKSATLSNKVAMSKERFGVFVSKLDLVLPLGDIQDVTCHVLRSRSEYDSGGITPDAFVAAAHHGGWFTLDFATRMSLREELQDHSGDHEIARRQLASTWNLHLSRLSVHGERDKNGFVSRHAVHQRQRITLALSPHATSTTNPQEILTLCRSFLRFSWQLGVLRCHSGDDNDRVQATSVSTLDMTRSSELILIAKGICSLPDVGPVHVPPDKLHPDDPYEADDLQPFAVVKSPSIRDLFPKGTPSSTQASECVELHRILQRYAWHLCEIFRSYSLVCNTSFGLTFLAFQELVQDMHVVSPHCTIVHINTIFRGVAQRSATEKNAEQPAPHHDSHDDDRITKDVFVELLLRLAVERHTRDARVTAPSLDQDEDNCRVSRIFDSFVTQFLLPNVCQAANHTFRQEVAALDVQRLLLLHRRFLRRVFLHYAKQDKQDVERSKMNLGEFKAFVSEFQLNDDVLFPPSMTVLVFNSVQDDVDERQCVFHEFTTAIVAIAQMKNSNPFLKWRRKTDEFIGKLVTFAHTNLRPLLLA
ncbi:hypothetical protein, variant [Aphanomyces invadans]|uniref:Uncharacterized protein n=1 Tax=Aphanomyces invadans TaxID=157072 RepID=A0A024ULD5_9STRA|nr:hypothetical protein, variant [Aphanomyces invadans]ETW07266.1 hypothetical protein, variant [Aphanomyces invadans]|eukprot:XP_008863359.1 hypothetical protein, variant [Aphanomyces invadans]